MTLFEKADNTYNNGDYSKAFAMFLELAQQNDDGAMDRVGSMYADGEGVAKDLQKAVEWYKNSVSVGGTTSLYNLGMVYKDEGNMEEAKRWFQKSLEHDMEAAVELAKLYLFDGDKMKVKNFLEMALNSDDIIPAVKEEAQGLYDELFPFLCLVMR